LTQQLALLNELAVRIHEDEKALEGLLQESPAQFSHIGEYWSPKIAGALAPFIATALFGVTGSSQLVTAYMATVSLISSLCVLGLKETYRQHL
jgi:hypothetical protein